MIWVTIFAAPEHYANLIEQLAMIAGVGTHVFAAPEHYANLIEQLAMIAGVGTHVSQALVCQPQQLAALSRPTL